MSTPTPVVMPRLGETVVEGTVARWFKAPGDTVAKLEPLLAISTDKIDTEVPVRRRHFAGNSCGRRWRRWRLARCWPLLVRRAPRPAPPSSPVHSAAPAAPSSGAASNHTPDSILNSTFNNRAEAIYVSDTAGRRYLSPVVKRLVREHGVNLGVLEGTGFGGRITRQDVLAYVGAQAVLPPACNDDFLHPLTPMRRALRSTWCRACAPAPMSPLFLRWIWRLWCATAKRTSKNMGSVASG